MHAERCSGNESSWDVGGHLSRQQLHHDGCTGHLCSSRSVPFPFLMTIFALQYTILPTVFENSVIIRSKNSSYVWCFNMTSYDRYHCLAVIFSHSSSYALCPTSRNVPDNVLAKLVSSYIVWWVSSCSYCRYICNRSRVIKPIAKKLNYCCRIEVQLAIYWLLYSMQKDNNGIVMVNFYSDFINCTDPAAATVGQVAGKLLHCL